MEKKESILGVVGFDQDSIKKKWTSLKRRWWKHIVKKSVWIVLALALTLNSVVVHFIEYSRMGNFFVAIGISISFLGTMVLAIPSTPALKRRSQRYKFSQDAEPAYGSFQNFEEIDKNDEGFAELLYLIEQEAGQGFGEVDKIVPEGNHLPTKTKINGEIYDVGSNDIRSRVKRIVDSLETVCHVKGVKILSIGFLVQMAGSLHIAITT